MDGKTPLQKWQILLLVPGFEVLRNEVNIKFGGHFYSICNSEWSYRLITNDNTPKFYTTSSQLTPDLVGTWTIITVLPFSPPIGSHKDRSIFIDEQNQLKFTFMWFLAHSILFFTWISFNEGRTFGFLLLQRVSGCGIELVWAHQDHKHFKIFSTCKRVMANFSLDSTHDSLRHKCFLTNFLFVRTSVTKFRVSNKFLKCPVTAVQFFGYL